MPTLTLPTTFTSGNTLTAANWNDNFYKPTVANSSFEIINGHLDSDNMDASWTEVTREQVQRFTFCNGWRASGTANLDYFNNWFHKINTADPTSDVADRPLAIPGANREFYLPYDAMVILTWTIVFGSASQSDDNKTRIHLYVDGTLDTAVSRSTHKVAPTGAAAYYERLPRLQEKLTYWSGHTAVEMDGEQWHSAGLRIIAHGALRHSRVWARSFRVIALKKDGTPWG